MKKPWSTPAVVFGLALSLLILAPGCVVRGQGTARVTAPAPVVTVDVRPPPPRRVQRPAPRAGQVWVAGRWERRGNRWAWQQGYWVTARTGYVWQPGSWVEANGRWRWVEGRWVVAAQTAPAPAPAPPPRRVVVRDPSRSAPPRTGGRIYVDVAPPAPRYERPAARRGYVWRRGHWERVGNRWQWRKGTWVRARAGYAWVPGRWETRNGRHYYVEGRWETARRGDRRRVRRR